MPRLVSIENGDVSVSVDMTNIIHISDTVPVLKAVLVIFGYHMRNVDELFDEEYRELDFLLRED